MSADEQGSGGQSVSWASLLGLSKAKPKHITEHLRSQVDDQLFESSVLWPHVLDTQVKRGAVLSTGHYLNLVVGWMSWWVGCRTDQVNLNGW